MNHVILACVHTEEQGAPGRSGGSGTLEADISSISHINQAPVGPVFVHERFGAIYMGPVDVVSRLGGEIEEGVSNGFCWRAVRVSSFGD